MGRSKLKLSAEQRKALDLLLSGANVLLTGKAGTGKSTVIAEFRRRNKKSAIYVAPTGIAALNIDGQTIHSCFQIPPGGCMADPGPISKKRFEILSRARVVVIDEISMVRADLLVAMDKRLRQSAKGSDSLKPFGGRQIIAVGDFFQLPPVVESENLYSYLCMRYGGVYPFQTELWDAADFRCIALDHIYRQRDTNYINALNGVRESDKTYLETLNTRVRQDLGSDKVITLSPYRAAVDRINEDKLQELPDPPTVYTGRLVGRFIKELPIPEILELKLGARVMIAANKYTQSGDPIYTNGELGVVAALSKSWVTVRLDDGRVVKLREHDWDMFEYDYSGSEVVANKVGTYTQIPLRLAWAVTIHKSQGCSFDQVILDLGRGCFAFGQLYTALSRVRSLSGLSLTRKICENDLKTDEAVTRFSRAISL